MATYKVTALFNYSSLHLRSGGWSESFYRVANSAQSAVTEMRRLTESRMALASNGVVCVGFRASDIGAPGISIAQPASLKGLQATDRDTPWQSAYINAQTNDGHKRSILLRGVPDGVIRDGELLGTPEWTTAFGIWQLRIEGAGFLLRGKDFGNLLTPIEAIDGAGNVTVSANLALVVGDVVEMYRVKDAFGQPVIGSFPVKTVTDAKHFALANWPTGTVVNKGKLRKLGFGFNEITKTTLRRVTLKKVGRPFFPYAGRR